MKAGKRNAAAVSALPLPACEVCRMPATAASVPDATKLIQTLPRVGYRIVAGDVAAIASEAIE